MSDVNVAGDQLRLFFERIESIEADQKDLADAKREVYSEAKANGYDVKVMRECLKLRAMETHDRNELDMVIDTYRKAVGIPNAA